MNLYKEVHVSILSVTSLEGAMAPTFSAQICLGLYLCWNIWVQAGPLPTPFLRAEPGLVIPQGKPVTLWCEGPPGAELYRLWKGGGYEDMEKSADGREAQFLISNMTAKTAGRYQCDCMNQSWWSEASDPLELRVTGSYAPPSLSALPSSQVASGQNVTLQCQSHVWSSRFALHRDGEEITYGVPQYDVWGARINFSISAVTPAHGGTYRCYSFNNYNPYEWSAPSDPLVLRVTDAPGLSSLQVGILMGTSAFLILLFLFLLLLCLQCWRHRTRLRKGGRDGGAKKTPRSSDPTGTPPEETRDVDRGEDEQTEEARPKDMAAPPGEDPQEVTYALLNLNSLKIRAEDPPPSNPGDPSLYAALR
ncbi:platelet glycoprotein VI-like isoform X2 [Macrotis lagotis]|uniref:platelet glycoprotein VI-like isoform X2 n=1 Tax=Macrotis lagotis TaxID=92651 RepID=UPI003D68D1D0